MRNTVLAARLMLSVAFAGGLQVCAADDGPAPAVECRILGQPEATLPSPARAGTVSVAGFFERTPLPVSTIGQTIRPDIFRPGYFSVFDALIATCRQRGIDIAYRFDPQLATHVIDAIGGQSNHWWYAAGYDGNSGNEEPCHRMDTFPCKDYTRVRVYPVTAERLRAIHDAFAAEVGRLTRNGGRVVVSTVTLDSPRQLLRFANVEVQPHGLRSDMFQPGVVTAADIMQSLGTASQLAFDLVWVDVIGRTSVQGYYFTRFNGEESLGRAGFIYELGERSMARGRGFGNNRFHMTPDIRVLCSPEYMSWRWADLGGGESRRRTAP